jgi:hypothetical protein
MIVTCWSAQIGGGFDQARVAKSAGSSEVVDACEMLVTSCILVVSSRYRSVGSQQRLRRHFVPALVPATALHIARAHQTTNTYEILLMVHFCNGPAMDLVRQEQLTIWPDGLWCHVFNVRNVHAPANAVDGH